MAEVELRDDLGSLRYSVELDTLVEVAGDYYCVAKSCEGCPHLAYCESEEAKTYIDFINPLRTIIKTNKDRVDYSSQEWAEGSKFVDGKWVGSERFPSASKKRVYKIVKSIEGVDLDGKEVPYVVFNFETKEYQCIKQRCENCKFKDLCNSELQIKEFENIIAVTDLAAQEPRSFTIATGVNKQNLEKNWVKVFYNDSIRAIEKPYHFLSMFFRKLGVDTENDYLWFKWVNRSFFYDKQDMYNLTSLVNELAVKEDSSVRENLAQLLNKLKESWDNFSKN